MVKKMERKNSRKNRKRVSQSQKQTSQKMGRATRAGNLNRNTPPQMYSLPLQKAQPECLEILFGKNYETVKLPQRTTPKLPRRATAKSQQAAKPERHRKPIRSLFWLPLINPNEYTLLLFGTKDANGSRMSDHQHGDPQSHVLCTFTLSEASLRFRVEARPSCQVSEPIFTSA